MHQKKILAKTQLNQESPHNLKKSRKNLDILQIIQVFSKVSLARVAFKLSYIFPLRNQHY